MLRIDLNFFECQQAKLELFNLPSQIVVYWVEVDYFFYIISFCFVSFCFVLFCFFLVAKINGGLLDPIGPLGFGVYTDLLGPPIDEAGANAGPLVVPVGLPVPGHRELLVSIRFNEPGWQWLGCFLPDHLGDTQDGT
ncbi:uncharacterized protein LOC114303167 [Camellia sinensis]|uniref:uncharacterized protein LOC114303167 n=1 Tax=Camellia sinensis TaxID=4442 RepID=UPI0010363A40|nr:uncharacterized protein LOC114303167 [Camellia sinensis]